MPTGSFHDSERLAHISALQLSRPVGNSAIETGRGGLPPCLSPAFGSNKAPP